LTGSIPVGPASSWVRYQPLNAEKIPEGMAGNNGRRRSKYTDLLESDATFRAWNANVLRASQNTGSAYFLRMGRLCHELCHISPAEIAAMNKTELMTFISNIISQLEEQGVTGVTITSYVKAIKSWARFNGKKLDEKVNVPESENTYSEEVVPKPDEVHTLLDHSTLRVKVAVSLMAFAGLRPATIGDSRGVDGLKVKDLPEIEVRDGKVTFPKVPTLITVRKKISKIRKPYDTFAPVEACDYIRHYLEDRMRMGEVITPESAIVTVSEFNARTETSGDCYFKKTYGEHMSTSKVRRMVRFAIRESGFGWRPYVLRRYFDTRMMLGEADGLIIPDWRSFWMGHAGNIEFVYTLRKALDEETVEKMRVAYLKGANRYLCTSEGAREEDVITKIRKQLLLTILTPDEIEKVHVDEKTDEELIGLLRQRLMEVTFNQGLKQKIVAASEVEEWLGKGWTWKGNLGDGRGVLEPSD